MTPVEREGAVPGRRRGSWSGARRVDVLMTTSSREARDGAGETDPDPMMFRKPGFGLKRFCASLLVTNASLLVAGSY